MSTVITDFQADWADWAIQQLKAQGYSSTTQDFEEVCQRFHNLRRRLISSRPRTLQVAQEFSCPAECQAGLALVRQKVEAGVDLRPHLSRRLTDLDFNDSLLNDWNIYHLHLGVTLDTDGFAKRTGPVLLARFEDKEAYFLNVEPHGQWASQRLLEIVKNNWPEILERFKLPEVVSPEFIPTDTEVALLRRNRITPLATIAGSTMASVGGGITMAGGSVDVVRTCTQLAGRLRRMESEVERAVPSQPGTTPRKFRLEIRGAEAFAVEDSTGSSFKLGGGFG